MPKTVQNIALTSQRRHIDSRIKPGLLPFEDRERMVRLSDLVAENERKLQSLGERFK